MVEEIQNDLYKLICEVASFNEMNLTDNIRWRLVMFSLNFLKEYAVDIILKGYYRSKDPNAAAGSLTPEGVNILREKRSVKIRKLKEICRNLPESFKEKIADFGPAKELEKKALIRAAAAGATTLLGFKERIFTGSLDKHSIMNLNTGNAASYSEKGAVDSSVLGSDDQPVTNDTGEFNWKFQYDPSQSIKTNIDNGINVLNKNLDVLGTKVNTVTNNIANTAELGSSYLGPDATNVATTETGADSIHAAGVIYSNNAKLLGRMFPIFSFIASMMYRICIHFSTFLFAGICGMALSAANQLAKANILRQNEIAKILMSPTHGEERFKDKDIKKIKKK